MMCKKHEWSKWKKVDIEGIILFVMCLNCKEIKFKGNIKNFKKRYKK